MPLEDNLPIELDPLTVTGERLTIRQETGFRLLRQALNRKPSSRRQDIDAMICWYESPTGTRLRYLMCARNGDRWAREYDDRTDGPRVVPGYGRIMRSANPVNPRRIQQILDSLPGDDRLDAEFVGLAFSGREPPRDIPDESEIEQFSRAYVAVSALDDSGAGDDAMEAAIEAEGLTLERYNRLIDLVDIYGSLRNQVSERVSALAARPPEPESSQ